MALKTPLGTILLQAYQEALKTRKATDFTVSGIASLIIRLEGRDGRVAVQETKRKTSPASASMNSPRQEASGKKSERLRFPKQEEEETDEAAMKVTSRLKRIGKEEDEANSPLSDKHSTGQNQSGNSEDAAVDIEELIAERDYYKVTAEKMAKKVEEAQLRNKPDEPSEEDKGFFKDLIETKDQEPKKENESPSNPNLPELKNQPPSPKTAKQVEPTPTPTPEVSPLSEAEQELIKQMKPAGAGREFGLERLRATLIQIGIEYEQEHSATVLAGALIKHLNPK